MKNGAISWRRIGGKILHRESVVSSSRLNPAEGRIDSRFVKKCEDSTADIVKTVSRATSQRISARACARENTHLNPIPCVAGKVIHGYPISCGVRFQSVHDQLIYMFVALPECPPTSEEFDRYDQTLVTRSRVWAPSSRISIRMNRDEKNDDADGELRNELVRATVDASAR
jgi:hypothetical protein